MTSGYRKDIHPHNGLQIMTPGTYAPPALRMAWIRWIEEDPRRASWSMDPRMWRLEGTREQVWMIFGVRAEEYDLCWAAQKWNWAKPRNGQRAVDWETREAWLRKERRRRFVPPHVRQMVIERSEGRCTYCGIETPANLFQIDHVLPYARGGRGHLRNLVAACAPCNVCKSAKSVEEWGGPLLFHGSLPPSGIHNPHRLIRLRFDSEARGVNHPDYYARLDA